MKVVLLENVSGVGVRGDIKDVADGYALNYLIPRRLAKFATPHMVAEAHTFRRRKATEQAAKTEKTHKILKMLDGKHVSITGKVNEQGHLFAQIHENDVALALSEQHGVDTSLLHIEFSEPIKAIGSYKTSVSTPEKENAVLYVDVSAEE